VLIGAGMALLGKAGLGIPAIALIPFPLAVIILMVVTMIRDRRPLSRPEAPESRLPEPQGASPPAPSRVR
jgi:hypothetical protein